MRHPSARPWVRLGAALLPVLLGVPGAVHAQADGTPAAGSLVERMCSVDVGSDVDLVDGCLQAVGAMLDRGIAPLDEEVQRLQGDLHVVSDQALDRLADVDLRAALDEAITAARDLDVQAAIRDALAAPPGAELGAALEEVVGRARDALDDGPDVDVDAFLDSGVATARGVVNEAQTWMVENADVVCSGGSLTVGVGTAAVVAYLTGSPGLAIGAFDRTEQLGQDICETWAAASAAPGAVASPGASPG
jgi:hypothetical protein